jgi:hypothetical protein
MRYKISHTILGSNPYISGDLFGTSRFYALMMLALAVLFGDCGPGKGGLEHAGCADVAIAAPALLGSEYEVVSAQS